MRKLAAAIYVAGAVVTGFGVRNERVGNAPADWALVAILAVAWPGLWAAVAVTTVNDVYNDRRPPSV